PKVGTVVTNHSQSSYVNSLEQYRFLASDELAHFIEARLYLEKAALRLAAVRLQKSDVTRLNSQLAEQSEALHSPDPELFPRLDRLFHRTIIEISQNKVLLQFLGMIWDAITQMTDIRNTQNRHTIFNYHTAIVKHLADRNLPLAEKAITEHLHDLTQNIERNIGHHTGLENIFKLERETASTVNM
ncbi:MAG: FCD domain-containing protein, partial [Candidatus Adiutrix sp.]|nr:FCD domain-containing protein [Candidatus Adiutrix sp.]